MGSLSSTTLRGKKRDNIASAVAFAVPVGFDALAALNFERAAAESQRRHFIGGSDARIIMGTDEGRPAAAVAERRCRQDGGYFSRRHGVRCERRASPQAARCCLTLMSDSAGMPSPVCSRQIILRVSERLRLSTSCTRLRLPMKGMRSRG